jgi:hypothetical protein
MRVLGPHCKQAADDVIPKTGPFGYLSFIGRRFFMTTLSALVIHETGAERPAREGQFSRLPVCSSVPPALSGGPESDRGFLPTTMSVFCSGSPAKPLILQARLPKEDGATRLFSISCPKVTWIQLLARTFAFRPNCFQYFIEGRGRGEGIQNALPHIPKSGICRAPGGAITGQVRGALRQAVRDTSRLPFAPPGKSQRRKISLPRRCCQGFGEHALPPASP